jgi:hypothetical protein
MTPEQIAITQELAKLSNKFKLLGQRQAKPSDYTEIEKALTRIRLKYGESAIENFVATFNGRDGDVTLTYEDVVLALGFVPGTSGGTNSNVLIDGGTFTAPNENVLIDGGLF